MENSDFTQSACNNIKNTIENTSVERLEWLIEKFKDFKKDCYTNEQTSIIDDILFIARRQYNQKKEESIELVNNH